MHCYFIASKSLINIPVRQRYFKLFYLPMTVFTTHKQRLRFAKIIPKRLCIVSRDFFRAFVTYHYLFLVFAVEKPNIMVVLIYLWMEGFEKILRMLQRIFFSILWKLIDFGEQRLSFEFPLHEVVGLWIFMINVKKFPHEKALFIYAIFGVATFISACRSHYEHFYA